MELRSQPFSKSQ